MSKKGRRNRREERFEALFKKDLYEKCIRIRDEDPEYAYGTDIPWFIEFYEFLAPVKSECTAGNLVS